MIFDMNSAFRRVVRSSAARAARKARAGVTAVTGHPKKTWALCLAVLMGVFVHGPVSAEEALVNMGMNDSWYSPEENGQGFLITVLPAGQVVSVSWFTFDTDLPAPEVQAELGYAGHRWFTALGDIAEGSNEVVLDIYLTQGLTFREPAAAPLADKQSIVGEMVLEFSNCNSATVVYDFQDSNVGGIIDLERVAPDADLLALCEQLSGAGVQPPSVSLQADKDVVTTGDKVTLNWQVSGADSCTTSGGTTEWRNLTVSPQNGSRSVDVDFTGSVDFTLSCTNSGGTTPASKTVTGQAASGDLPSVTLSVLPSTQTRGKEVTFTWQISGADSCDTTGGTDQWRSLSPQNGTSSIPVLVDFTGAVEFTLSCSNSAGPRTVVRTVTGEADETPPSVTLSVSPSSQTQGQEVTFNWTVVNASSCTTKDGNAAWGDVAITLNNNGGNSDSVDVVVDFIETRVFTLECSNDFGDTPASESVTGTEPSQGTDRGSPVVTLTVLDEGSEKVVDGTFDIVSDWVEGPGWSIGGGQAASDGTQTAESRLAQDAIKPVLGYDYTVEYTITQYQAGKVRLEFGGQKATERNRKGTFVETIRAANIDDGLALVASADFKGTIDNVSVKDGSGEFLAKADGPNGSSRKFRWDIENYYPYVNDQDPGTKCEGLGGTSDWRSKSAVESRTGTLTASIGSAAGQDTSTTRTYTLQCSNGDSVGSDSVEVATFKPCKVADEDKNWTELLFGQSGATNVKWPQPKSTPSEFLLCGTSRLSIRVDTADATAIGATSGATQAYFKTGSGTMRVHYSEDGMSRDYADASRYCKQEVKLASGPNWTFDESEPVKCLLNPDKKYWINLQIMTCKDLTNCYIGVRSSFNN